MASNTEKTTANKTFLFQQSFSVIIILQTMLPWTS